MNLKEQNKIQRKVRWKKPEDFSNRKDYLRKNAQSFSKKSAEMRRENKEWFEEARLRFLNKERIFLQKKIAKYPAWIEKSNKDIDQELLLGSMEACEKKLKKIEYTIKILSGIENNKNEVTNEMIEHAKQFPIEALVDVNNKKFAHCVNHDDKNASMYCKNNFGYCFSCGWSGDTISILMKISGLSFKESVIRLNK